MDKCKECGNVAEESEYLCNNCKSELNETNKMTGIRDIFFYTNKNGREFIKRIFDYDKKEETFVVVSKKPSDGASISISVYDNINFFLDKNYIKSNPDEFALAYNAALSDCA